jgi:hypothetical protein
MQRIKPRTLTTQELLRFSVDMLCLQVSLPVEYQHELVNRLTDLHKIHGEQIPAKDPRQLDLFL